MSVISKIFKASPMMSALIHCTAIVVGLLGLSAAKSQAASGRTLFGVTQCCPNEFVTIDPSTGGLTPLSAVGDASVGFALGAAAVDRNTHQFFLVRISGGLPHIIAINTQTGAVVESPALSQDLIFLGFDFTTGALFGVTQCCPNEFVTIDPSTGGLTPLSAVGDASVGFALGAAAVDPNTHQFFLVRISGGLPHIIAINTQTGAVVESPALSQDLIFLGFDFTTGALFGVTECCPNEFVTIDPSTGGLTPLSVVGDASVGFALGAAAVDPNTHQFFLVRISGGLPHIIAINTQTGAVVGSPALSQDLTFLGFDFTIPITVAIDLKPGGFPNSINPRSRGVIPVAILSDAGFDATTVDPTTVLFGPTGTEAPPVHAALKDVDRDGDTDIILHFKTQKTGIVCGHTSASIIGETFSGQTIRGSDSIKTVGCK